MKAYEIFDSQKTVIAVVNSELAVMAVARLMVGSGIGLRWRGVYVPPLVSRDLQFINGRMQ